VRNYLILIGLFVFISCSTREEPGDVITSEFERITSVITKDSWKVISFVDNGEDVTSSFSDFVFVFDEDGTLSIEAENFSETGNWLYQGLPFKGELLSIAITDSGLLDSISEEWNIETLINTQVELFIDNENTNKLLTFERI
jgi:hypothetical protein